jgi:integrase
MLPLNFKLLPSLIIVELRPARWCPQSAFRGGFGRSSRISRNSLGPLTNARLRHGVRAAEVVDLRWEQVDFKTASLHIRRAQNGTSATHPLSGREMRELRRHQRESAQSPFVLVSERGSPLSAPGFSRMVERAAVAADLGIKAYAHMLRHACGYKLANDGHDTRAIQAYLGHRNIQNTTRYTALAPQRFKEFFRD